MKKSRSASGKSTPAMALETFLCENGCRTYILDGDPIRPDCIKNFNIKFRRIPKFELKYRNCKFDGGQPLVKLR